LHHHKTFTFTQIPSWKSSRLQTWNLKLQTQSLLYKALEGFTRECSNLTSISSNFSSVSTQHFDLVPSVQQQPYLSQVHSWCINSFYLFVTVTSWNLCWNLLLTSHMDIIPEHSFQHVTLTCHFDRSNMTCWMFNTVARTWNYGQQACDT
jgi:hypothetical protein